MSVSEKLKADLVFYDEVLAAIDAAAAKRQVTTHQPHSMTEHETHAREQFELLRIGCRARLTRSEILPHRD